MKLKHIILMFLLVACAFLLWLFSSTDLAVVESGEPQSMKESVLSAESYTSPEAPRLIEAPSAIEDPKQPVQSLEERGDAMLFEGEALQGTPFDKAVVMPFEE